MRPVSLSDMLDLVVALSRETDHRNLLSALLGGALRLTGCDSGAAFLLEGDALRPQLTMTQAGVQWEAASGHDRQAPPISLRALDPCAQAVLTRVCVNVPDLPACARYDFTGCNRYSALPPHTPIYSLLAVPLVDGQGDRLGVLLLLNCRDSRGAASAFSAEYERVVFALCCLCAITLANARHIGDIQALFHSFVRVLSTAIDERTPYNANHTKSMARYAERFFAYLSREHRQGRLDKPFTRDEEAQLIMAIWLHDIGKLVTPMEIMNKATRLAGRLDWVLRRFDVIALESRVAQLSGQLDQDQYDLRQGQIAQARELVRRVNLCRKLSAQDAAAVREVAARTYTDVDGVEKLWLDPDEAGCLLTPSGTLSGQERRVMENHVVLTSKLLGQIRFSREYRDVPGWAGCHHELLDGSGYPNGLKGREIARPVRLLTLLDVFDALTAQDRPYKPPLPVAQALDVLGGMAAQGKLDQELVELFCQSRAWE